MSRKKNPPVQLAMNLTTSHRTSPMDAPDYGWFKVHPFDDCFPLISHEAFASLVADIAKNGLLHPIALTADGTTIVDGRLRYLACVEARVDPRFINLPEDFTEERIRAWIMSANVYRQSFNKDQRAMIAARIVERLADQRPPA
jgi:hypothetical protein